jgi:hypothetical protein
MELPIVDLTPDPEAVLRERIVEQLRQRTEGEPVTVILFCPCCCSALDTYSHYVTHTCATCGQMWLMQVDTARITEHAP